MKRFVLLFALIGGYALADPTTVLELSGSPESYVVGNQTLTITPSEGFTFTGTVGSDDGMSEPDDLEISATNFTSPTSSQFWYLDLAVPEGQLLAPGFYGNATRFPFEEADAPGLSLYGDGRGDNRSSGYFDILEISYSGSQLLSLAADFVQYDELNMNAVSSGSVRFNSDIPIGTPEPATLIPSLLGFLCLGAFLHSRRKIAV